MKQTHDFYQIIAVYPNSKLAQDYVNAMTAADTDAQSKADGSDGSGQAINDAITSGPDAFFQSTTDYKQVSTDKICVLEFYYNNFPFVWANFDSATYYLYSNSDDGSTTTFAGTLTLTKPATIDITKANSGYTCSFNPATNPTDLTKTDVNPGQAKSLTYSDGLFVASSMLPCLSNVFIRAIFICSE